MDDLWSILEKKLSERTGSFSRSTSYLEYYNDIIAHVLMDMVSLIEPEKITPSIQAKINILSAILEHSSINLNDISNPMEGYKVEGIIEMKDINHELRQLYMSAWVENQMKLLQSE